MRSAIAVVLALALVGLVLLWLRERAIPAAPDELTPKKQIPPPPSGPTFTVGGVLHTVDATSTLGCQAIAMGKGVAPSLAKIGCEGYGYLTPVGQATWVYDHAGAGASAVKGAASSAYNTVKGWF